MKVDNPCNFKPLAKFSHWTVSLITYWIEKSIKDYKNSKNIKVTQMHIKLSVFGIDLTRNGWIFGFHQTTYGCTFCHTHWSLLITLIWIKSDFCSKNVHCLWRPLHYLYMISNSKLLSHINHKEKFSLLITCKTGEGEGQEKKKICVRLLCMAHAHPKQAAVFSRGEVKGWNG